MAVDPNKQTSLHCLYYWAEHTPDNVFLTQPYPDGRVEDITWREAADQVSRMAAHLNTLGLPQRSNIGILGKNSAHWILSDLAIWAAGHVSVPLYPTLNGETAAIFWTTVKLRCCFSANSMARPMAGMTSKAIFPSNYRLSRCPYRLGTTRPNGRTSSPNSPRRYRNCPIPMIWPPLFTPLAVPGGRRRDAQLPDHDLGC